MCLWRAAALLHLSAHARSLIVRTWAGAFYSVFDRAKLAVATRAFGALLVFSTLWQFLYAVAVPLAGYGDGHAATVAMLVHHNVRTRARGAAPVPGSRLPLSCGARSRRCSCCCRRCCCCCYVLLLLLF